MVATTRIDISVRELVDLVWSSGDLRAEPGLRAAPLDGIRGHQWIQRSRPDSYRTEVPVSKLISRGALTVRVAGRADGVDSGQAVPVLEEIKTVSRPLILIEEHSHPLHWAQAKTYAAIYAEHNDCAAMDVRLTYLHLDSRQVRTFTRRFSTAELAGYLEQTSERLFEWLMPTLAWHRQRDASIRDLHFPFPQYRLGQRELIDTVSDAISSGRRLFAQAPTGTGKTVAVIMGALEALAANAASQLFFLTAKTTGRAAAEKALVDLRGTGLTLRSLTLTARDAICPHPDRACRAGDCPLAEGHYDRIGDAVRGLVEQEVCDRPAIERIAATKRVCPFLLAIAAVPWVDAVICDFNYVFDPRVSPKVMEAIAIGRRIYLVDEAHNLVDRAREMFSAEICTSEINKGVAAAQKISGTMVAALDDARAAIEVAADPTTSDRTRWQLFDSVPPRLIDALELFLDEIEAWLAQPEQRLDDDLLNLYFQAHGLVRQAQRGSERHAVFTENVGRGRLLKIFCVDPAADLESALGRHSPAIFFSATLSPLRYFARILDGTKNAKQVCFASPFPRHNLCVALVDRVSTRYRDRNSTLDRVVGLIAAAFRSHPANHMAYLTSYEYLSQVVGRFRELAPDIPHVVQAAGMSEAERREFLERFTARSGEPILGFAVLGGAFGEGIDLVGENLSGAVVVGVGLPAICAERELIRDHFARSEGSRDTGFDFAYLFPGMNRVLQAAGRVIRSENDRGAIVLVGERFAEPGYRRLLPAKWPEIAIVRTEVELKETLNRFWAR